jgi:O-acetyl-ADP-ribose deacetylase (regulator of RNase III)
MISFVTGSIFDSRLEALVCPVNCVGIMGKGLALDFKRAYPQLFRYYRLACRRYDLAPGLVDFWPDPSHPFKFISLFPTKNDWRTKSTIEIVDAGLISFVKIADSLSIRSAAFPMLGCGLGGLDFEEEVLPLMVKYFDNDRFDIHVYIRSA